MRIIATAGHVDHGKSSLVLALTGTDPDRFAEEKRRGLTIDLGFAHTTLPNGEGISIVDVPGHVRFLRNMLAGVGGIDACLFVVAATEGWKPQSEEHLRILELLGSRDGVIALTKVDLVDDEWRDLAALDVADHVAGTFLADAPIVPVSATTGTGLDDLRDALATLVVRTPGARDAGRPRLWVDRAFAAKGSGTVVTGTLTGGQLVTGDHVDLLPARLDVRVRGVQTHGSAAERIGPGNRVALNLAGIDHHAVQRGDVVVHAGQWRPTARFDASLEVLGSLDHVVSRRGAYVAYIGSGEWPVRLRVLGPASLAPGSSGLVRLQLAQPLPLVMGDRYVLRESGRNETVGGGEVLDVAPMLPASRARPDRSVDRVVREHGWIDVGELLALTGEIREPMVGRWVVDPDALAHASEELRGALERGGQSGIDTATLSPQQRALLEQMDIAAVVDGRAYLGGARDELAEHPLLERLRRERWTPGDAPEVDRGTIRALVRRGLVVERDGILFHPEAIDLAIDAIAALLRERPDGVTVSECRERLGVSRKYALPLLSELDARGVTRRRADLRVPGPRLPAA